MGFIRAIGPKKRTASSSRSLWISRCLHWYELGPRFVKITYCYEDKGITLDGAVDTFMIAARRFAAELEREKRSQRTHEHLLTKARRGLVVGGRVFGYDNVEVKNGDRRVHVEYKINEEQASIVREIFERYADGQGLRTIAKDLNARKVAPPRAGKRGTGSWSTSVLWAMLRRERYGGILIWNTREKTYRGGTKVRIARDASEWIKADAPELRIVEDELWFRAQAKTERVTNPQGKKARGRPHRHLLSGFARCGECGGPLTVTNGWRSHESIKVYSCAYSRDRGKSVCTNTLRRPVDAVNQAVAEWITDNLLSEDLVVEVIATVRERLSARAKVTSSEVPNLEKGSERLRKEIDRLVAALAATDQKPAGTLFRRRMAVVVEGTLHLVREQIVSTTTASKSAVCARLERGFGLFEAFLIRRRTFPILRQTDGIVRAPAHKSVQ